MNKLSERLRGSLKLLSRDADAASQFTGKIVSIKPEIFDPINEAATALERAEEALTPFAESIVIDPNKQRGERHWATVGKLTDLEDVLRAQEALSLIRAEGVGDD